MSAQGTPRPGTQPPRGRARQGKAGGVPRWTLALGALAVVGVAAYLLVLRPSTQTAATGRNGLPGPLGGPDVAQDVNTMVGKPAPAFTLPDSEGKSYTVTPGRGKALVLISHMGLA